MTELDLYQTDNEVLRKKILLLQSGCLQAIFRLNYMIEWGDTQRERDTAEMIKALLIELPGVRRQLEQAEEADAETDRRIAEAGRAGR